MLKIEGKTSVEGQSQTPDDQLREVRLLCGSPHLIATIHSWLHVVLIWLGALGSTHIRVLIEHVLLVHTHLAAVWIRVRIREVGGRWRLHVRRWRVPTSMTHMRTATCTSRLALFHIRRRFENGWWWSVASWVRCGSHAI